MTPHRVDAARNADQEHDIQTIRRTTTASTRTTTRTSSRTMNQENTSTSTKKDQITNQTNQGRNQKQSTNRAGIPMPPAGGPRAIHPSRARQIGRPGSASTTWSGVSDAA